MKLFPLIGSLLVAASVHTQAMELSSPDIKEGHFMAKTFEYQGFGCSGDNLSPALSWSDIPEDTKSFAITVFDPDAPTGSGWWHWAVVDIPLKVTAIARGQKMDALGAKTLGNDYGETRFGGACPPPGHGMHRYQFTVWALPVETLQLPADPSLALLGYQLGAQALGKATITATYSR